MAEPRPLESPLAAWEQEEAVAPPASFLKEVATAYRRNRMAMAGAAVVLVLALLALLVGHLSPYDPYQIDLDLMSQIEGYLRMHHHDGIVKRGKIRARNL